MLYLHRLSSRLAAFAAFSFCQIFYFMSDDWFAGPGVSTSRAQDDHHSGEMRTRWLALADARSELARRHYLFTRSISR